MRRARAADGGRSRRFAPRRDRARGARKALPADAPRGIAARRGLASPGRGGSRRLASPAGCRRAAPSRRAWYAPSAAEPPVQPLVKMHLGVLHRRLVRTGVVEALLVERAAAAVEAL